MAFDLKFGMPGLTHDQVMTTIALDGTQVIPRVRELLDRERLPRPEDVAEPTNRRLGAVLDRARRSWPKPGQ
jgi:hypothetical protein